MLDKRSIPFHMGTTKAVDVLVDGDGIFPS